MNHTYVKHFQTINSSLGIEKILSIRFSDVKTNDYEKYQDTACTAIIRSMKKEIRTFIDRKMGQLCPGGDYFLNITRPSQKEICDVYVKQEKVFQNQTTCRAFLKDLPKYPQKAEKRYILLTPLTKETRKPDVIMLLVNPAQAGRILGLGAYKKMSLPTVIPSLPTCAAIYAPLKSKQIHLNFIDYFDRYYQGKQKGKLLWDDRQMIISMTFKIFEEIIEAVHFSSHGSYKPKIRPQKIDDF